MKLDWQHWIKGLAAAFIGGGSSAAASGVTAIGIAPEQFNLAGGLKHTLTLMAANFVVSGVISAFAYLKQSPVPQEWDGQDRRGQGG